MTRRMSSGCLKTILDEYLDSFAAALGEIGNEYILDFDACYGDASYHVEGRCEYCTCIRMRYTAGRLDILMRRLDDLMHVECSLPFCEAMDIIADYMPARGQLAFLRIQTNYQASHGSGNRSNLRN